MGGGLYIDIYICFYLFFWVANASLHKLIGILRFVSSLLRFDCKDHDRPQVEHARFDLEQRERPELRKHPIRAMSSLSWRVPLPARGGKRFYYFVKGLC